MINILKKILSLFSPNTIFRIRYFLFWLLEKNYSQKDFPLNVKSQLFDKFTITKKKFLLKAYQAPEHFGFVSPNDLHNFVLEIIPFYKEKTYKSIKKKYDSILPISLNSEKKIVSIKQDGITKTLRNLPSNRFHYFYLKKKIDYNFFSKNLSIGNPFIIHGLKKPKINIVLFADGFSHPNNFLQKTSSQKYIMPNISEFFEKSIQFNSHYSDSEWTLPSTASLFTGTYQQTHRFFHPEKFHMLNSNSTIMLSFQKAGFTTFFIGGGWRNSPAYGHAFGADRALYQKYMKANNLINHTIDHISGLKNNNHFIQMTLLETHHLLGTIPEFSSQVNLKTEAHKVTPFYNPENNKKSIDTKVDLDLTEIYIEQIKKLDQSLGVFFDFLSVNYTDEQLYVSLVSDHGQSFLSSETNTLCKARLNVPWFLKYPNSKKIIVNDITQNVDFYSTMHFINNMDVNNKIDSIVPQVISKKNGRKYSFSQSIYPNKKYSLSIRSNKHEYFFETNKRITNNGFIGINEGYFYTKKDSNGKIINNNDDDQFIKEMFFNFVQKWNKGLEKK